MNRNELVDAVAGKTELRKTEASKAVDAVFDAIAAALKGGDEVRLVGFGTFSVASRAASEGRNPRTGEKIKIAASKQAEVQAGQGIARLAELTLPTRRNRRARIRRGTRWAAAGRLAQLVEHLVYTEGVGGSNPSSPTIPSPSMDSDSRLCLDTLPEGTVGVPTAGRRPRGRSSVG